MKRKKRNRKPEERGKHAGVLKRPPTICQKCGPADKMARVPNACEKCGYRIAADPELANKIATDIQHTERAAMLVWEITGRHLDDLHKRCPFEINGEAVHEWKCKGFPCTLDMEETGEEIHPHWRCWTAWLGYELKAGKYQELILQAKRMELKRKKEQADGPGKENTK